MIRHPQRSTRPHPPFPDLTLLRAKGEKRDDGRALDLNVRWAPALLDSTEVDALSAAMPGPITALARADARSVNLDVLGAVVDAIVTEAAERSEEHKAEHQSLKRISYAVFRLKKKKTNKTQKS